MHLRSAPASGDRTGQDPWGRESTFTVGRSHPPGRRARQQQLTSASPLSAGPHSQASQGTSTLYRYHLDHARPVVVPCLVFSGCWTAASRLPTPWPLYRSGFCSHAFTRPYKGSGPPPPPLGHDVLIISLYQSSPGFTFPHMVATITALTQHSSTHDVPRPPQHHHLRPRAP